jgi:hypothetical protein
VTKPPIYLAAQAGKQTIGMRQVARPDEHRRPRDHSTIGRLDRGQPVVLDQQPCYLTAPDLHPACFQLDVLGWTQVIGVEESDHSMTSGFHSAIGFWASCRSRPRSSGS